MDDSKIKIKTIFSMAMAGYCMYKGNMLITMDKDKKQTGRDVYIFKDTPKLSEAMQEYLASK